MKIPSSNSRASESFSYIWTTLTRLHVFSLVIYLFKSKVFMNSPAPALPPTFNRLPKNLKPYFEASVPSLTGELW
jgi:hypothetical protein